MKNKTEEITEEKIIDILKKNKEGLTLTKLSKELNCSAYIARGYIAVLVSKSIISMIDIGSCKLIKLKN